jgi:hypothetical protein
MIRSGRRAAIFSRSSWSSLRGITSGVAVPNAARAHGQTPPRWSPYQSVSPAGATPSART